MKFHLLGVAAFAVASILFTGCQPGGAGKGDAKTPKGDAKAAPKTDEDDHDHGPGPHGGVIIEFDGKRHGEFAVDHKKQEATIFILGGDAKSAFPIDADKVTLSIKSPQFQIELTSMPQEKDPKGKSSRFVGKHENFAKEQEFEGTVTFMDGKKQINGDLEKPKKEKK